MNAALAAIRKIQARHLAWAAALLTGLGYSAADSVRAAEQVKPALGAQSGGTYTFSTPAPQTADDPSKTGGQQGGGVSFSLPAVDQRSSGDAQRPAAAPPAFQFSAPPAAYADAAQPARGTGQASSHVTFSDIGEVPAASQEAASQEAGPMASGAAGPQRDFQFSPPRDDAGDRLFPDSRQARSGVRPVTFSPPASTPFQSSWAHFLQDEQPGDPDAAANVPETPLGEAPEETNTTIQFLRQDTILLRPGQYQFDVTFQYISNEASFAAAQINNNVLQIGDLTQRQRLLLMPLEFRIGVTPDTQFFVNVPFGWSNGEAIFQGQDEIANVGGIGDVSLGLTRQLYRADQFYPNILASVGVSAPTGNSSFATSLSTPGSSLGQGFWTTTAALTFTRTFDPVVLFGGIGYQWRFEGSFDTPTALGQVRVQPGDQAFYRFGVGFAVNPQVTFSAAFRGSYIAETYVNDVRVVGSSREPMQVRLATTIARKRKSLRGTVRTIEPFVEFGLTQSALDSVFGIGWTY